MLPHYLSRAQGDEYAQAEDDYDDVVNLSKKRDVFRHEVPRKDYIRNGGKQNRFRQKRHSTIHEQTPVELDEVRQVPDEAGYVNWIESSVHIFPRRVS